MIHPNHVFSGIGLQDLYKFYAITIYSTVSQSKDFLSSRDTDVWCHHVFYSLIHCSWNDKLSCLWLCHWKECLGIFLTETAYYQTVLLSKTYMIYIIPTFAALINDLAVSISPWWFCPTSAIMKHGCDLPTHLPGANSISIVNGDYRDFLSTI